MRMYPCLLLLCGCTWVVSAQSTQQTLATPAHSAQDPGQPSGTYGDTLKAIRTWIDSEKNDDLSRLLAIGETRTPEFVKACHSSDENIAGAAFFALQLLAKPECRSCVDFVSQKHGGVPFTCSGNIEEQDFQRIERWLATKRVGTGYECGEDYDPLTNVSDSVLYALILDGSSRSRSLLGNMRAFLRACSSEDTITGEILEESESLIQSAKELGHNLNVEQDRLEASVRASAFFLPQHYRAKSKVEVIATTEAHDRMLLEVSYHCGMLCGKGYYVVLRKDGDEWHYAMITMAWIS